MTRIWWECDAGSERPTNISISIGSERATSAQRPALNKPFFFGWGSARAPCQSAFIRVIRGPQFVLRRPSSTTNSFA